MRMFAFLTLDSCTSFDIKLGCVLSYQDLLLDALVFTGGIGENSRFIRATVIENLAIFGFRLDNELNARNGDMLGVISTGPGPKVVVIETKEELMIARAALALI